MVCYFLWFCGLAPQFFCRPHLYPLTQWPSVGGLVGSQADWSSHTSLQMVFHPWLLLSMVLCGQYSKRVERETARCLKAWPWQLYTNPSAWFHQPKQCTRPARIQGVGKEAPPLDRRQGKVTLQRGVHVIGGICRLISQSTTQMENAEAWPRAGQ